MKKLLLLLIIPFLSFGQLGDYYIATSNSKTKGLSFKIKKPFGYKQFEGKIATTIVGFNNNSNSIDGLTELYISIYSLKDWGMEFIQTMSKNEIKSVFLDADMDYYELCGFPGWIAEENNLGHHIQSFTIIDKNVFVIKLAKISGLLSSKEKELFHKVAKSLIFF